MIAFSGNTAISSIDDFDIHKNGTTRVSDRYVDDQGMTNRLNIKSDSAFTLDAGDFDFGYQDDSPPDRLMLVSICPAGLACHLSLPDMAPVQINLAPGHLIPGRIM